jgi:hypothetical protein
MSTIKYGNTLTMVPFADMAESFNFIVANPPYGTKCLIWNDLRICVRITTSILILLAFHSNPVLFYWKSEPEGIDFVHPSPCHGLSNKTKATTVVLKTSFQTPLWL